MGIAGSRDQTGSSQCRCGGVSALNPFCERVREESRKRLCDASRPLFIRKRARITSYDVETEVFVVCSGAIASLLITETGKSHVLSIAEAGHVANVMRIAGQTSLFEEDFNDGHFGYALTGVHGCAISLDVVRDVFASDPDFAKLILAEITDRYKSALTGMSLMTELSGADRIAWLFDQIETAGVDVSEVTHETIGWLLGMNRVSVTRLMGDVLSRRSSS